ncbi:TRAP transporter large permease [Anaerostipes hadrus]|uniref:TRAP transporter large permease n=1 Tax=Anaerostipes hadrus TaxID=649756 RepID=A0AAQ3JIQ4_ANAHA|nr:TRAP transporter large permease [Anaerostipes hadrus]WMD16866.1 TRAP transporter large permease [Anaerostipes hadrus]WMD25671.1 TRAP transporter large permease [Anaerostipes hadrus]
MTAILFIGLIVLLILGVPIAFVLCGSSILAILTSGDIHGAIVIQRMFSGSGSFTLLAIPFFVLAGNLMSVGGISKRLVNLCNSLFGHISGGLAMVAIITCAFFAAISGSSAATAAAVGTIIIPEMLHHKYDKDFAAATVASSAELGVIIPPSIGLIQYGVATGTSISDLFMAGFLPGIFICLVLCIVAHFMCKKQGFEPSKKATHQEKIQALKDSILAILMPVIILGGIYSGLFTPTEAAVIAVFYGLFVGLFIYKEITLKDIPKILSDSAMTMATVLLIMSASTIFGWILTKLQIPQAVAKGFLGISSSKYIFLLLVNVLLLFIGMFCEAGAAMVILAPLLAPVAVTLGIDLVHFGVIMMSNLAIGMMTPPVGVNLYVVCDTAKVKIEGMFPYLVKYFFALVAGVLIITYIPQLSLLFVNLFGK